MLVLINDGSTDNSWRIIKELSIKYENILIVNQPNSGIAATRNAGLRVADGEYVVFMDQDDAIDVIILRETLQKIKHVKADFVISNYYISEKKKQKCVAFEKEVYLTNEDLEKTYINFLTTYTMGGALPRGINYIPGVIWNCIFTKVFLEINDIRFKKFVDYEDDYLFLIDCFSKSKRVLTSCDSYYCWYIYPSSESHKKKYIVDYAEKRQKLNRYLIKHIEELGYSKEKTYYFLRYLHSITVLKGLRNICGYTNKGSWNDVRKELRAICSLDDYEIDYHFGEGKMEKIELFLLKHNFVTFVAGIVYLRNRIHI